MKTISYSMERSRSQSRQPHLVAPRPKLVAIIVLQPVKTMDLIAIAEVFAEANRSAESTCRYQVQLVSAVDGSDLSSQSGLFTYATTKYQDLTEAVDTLIVVGPEEFVRRRYGDEFMTWLHRLCVQTRRVASVSTGTLLLADAGLLNGRRVAVHWKLQDRVLRDYSRLQLVRDVLYVRDGEYYTCAGATAGIDLTLAFVEQDHGLQIANDVARSMLLYLRRTGNTRQVSVTLEAQGLQGDRIADLIAWLPDNLREDLSIKTLAKRLAMSQRNFARLFKKGAGATPAKYIHDLRLEAAQRQLTYSGLTIEGVAEACGFPNSETLRRLFSRRLQLAPGQYRSCTANVSTYESSI